MTPRQQQVLDLIAQGKTLDAIAHELGLSIESVTTYRRDAIRSLGAFNTPQATNVIGYEQGFKWGRELGKAEAGTVKRKRRPKVIQVDTLGLVS